MDLFKKLRDIDEIDFEGANKPKFMKIFLNDGFNFIVIPVNPETIEIKGNNKNETYDVYKGGEVNVLNPSGLETISFSAFFPFYPDRFPYVTTIPLMWRPIAWYSSFFKKRKRNGEPVRLTIPALGLSKMVSIEQFDQSETFGDMDRWYELSLKEYVANPITTGTINPDGTLTIDESRIKAPGMFAIGEKIKARGKALLTPVFDALSPFMTSTLASEDTESVQPQLETDIEDKIVTIVLQDPATKKYLVVDELGNSLGWMDPKDFTQLT